MQDVPTLRLVTLRRLLAKTPPPVVIERPIVQHDAPFAVVVDETRVVRGTMARGEAEMSTRFVALEPEDDADTAVEALRAENADRVVVISRSGELLGVLTCADVMPPA